MQEVISVHLPETVRYESRILQVQVDQWKDDHDWEDQVFTNGF